MLLKMGEDGMSERWSPSYRWRGPPAHVIASVVLAAAIVLLGLWTARSFLLALTWAIIIGIAAWPLYERFAQASRGQRSKTFAPAVFTLLTGFVVLCPLGFAAVMAGREGAAAALWLVQARQHGIPTPDWIGRLPYMGDRVATWWQANLSNPDAPSHLLEELDFGVMASWTETLGTALVSGSILFVVTLLALFFLLRDGDWLGRTTMRVAAMCNDRLGPPLVERTALAIRGTVVGTVLVALAEGGLLSAGYVLAGVPRPALFGLLTVAFAMLPLGAWLVFTAASLLLLAQGSLTAGLGLFAFGALVAGVGNNMVQPALVGGATQLPFLWAFVGTLGGLQTFGLVGLFIGPAIMAAILSLFREWIAHEGH